MAMERINPSGTGPCKDCVFCQISLSESTSKPVWDTVLIETENFFVVPTKGALLEGWLLIVPRVHYIAMGAIPRSIVPELHNLVNHVSKLVTEKYCKPIFFEHGPSRPKEAFGCGVDHAHFHLVPISTRISRPASTLLGLPTLFSVSEFWAGWPLANYYTNGINYLMLNEGRDFFSCWASPKSESQLFRRLIADEIGTSERYDYKKYAFKTNVDRTIEALYQTETTGNFKDKIRA